MSYTEELRIQKLEEIERAIEEQNFYLELLIVQKEKLTPIVTKIKEKNEKEKKRKIKPTGNENPIGSDGDFTDDDNRDIGTDDSVSGEP